MNFFKILLATIFMLLSLNIPAVAQSNFSWVTVPVGSLDGSCRTFWKEYDALYHTSTTIMPVRAGLSGGLVVEDFLHSNKPNSAICIGASQLLLNSLLYPGKTKEDQLEPLVLSAQWPFVWYVPSDTPANSYNDLIRYFQSLNRPINVGMFIPIFEVIGPIFAQHGITINPVNFKNSTQQYPSLADGSLDLAFDAGGGLQVANQTKKFKAIGYVDTAKNPQLQGLDNFVDSEPDLRVILTAGGMIIAVQKSMPDLEQKQLTERITKVLQSNTFKTSIAKFNSRPTEMTSNALVNHLETNRRLINKYWRR